MKDIIWKQPETGKLFKRIGECKRCGACGCNTRLAGKGCPHFEWKDGLATCKIYNKRTDEICQECKEVSGGTEVKHSHCIPFPNTPNASVIKEGKCGYKFIEI